MTCEQVWSLAGSALALNCIGEPEVTPNLARRNGKQTHEGSTRRVHFLHVLLWWHASAGHDSLVVFCSTVNHADSHAPRQYAQPYDLEWHSP
eukprot:1100024-Amphidinium_carterae.1